MAKRRKRPSQEWRTFLRNHADDVAAMDLIDVAAMDLIDYAPRSSEDIVVGRDRVSYCGRIPRQLDEACGWEETPIYLIRNRDGVVFKRRLRAMGIRDKPTLPARLGGMDTVNV